MALSNSTFPCHLDPRLLALADITPLGLFKCAGLDGYGVGTAEDTMSHRSSDLSPRERADVSYYLDRSFAKEPITIRLRQLPGTCQRVLPSGEKCGVPFVGSRNRRYCDQHSASIHYGGRTLSDPHEVER